MRHLQQANIGRAHAVAHVFIHDWRDHQHAHHHGKLRGPSPYKRQHHEAGDGHALHESHRRSEKLAQAREAHGAGGAEQTEQHPERKPLSDTHERECHTHPKLRRSGKLEKTHQDIGGTRQQQRTAHEHRSNLPCRDPGHYRPWTDAETRRRGMPATLGTAAVLQTAFSFGEHRPSFLPPMRSFAD